MSNVYEIITERLVALLETGTVPWQCPWKRSGAGGMPMNHTTGRAYRGVNVWTLTAAAQSYPVSRWLTFKQALAMGGCVRKGEHGFPVVFWKKLPPRAKPAGDTADGEGRPGFLLRYFTVFNVGQVDGIGSFEPAKPADVDTFRPIEEAERIAATYKLGPTIRHEGQAAFYSSLADAVTLPPRESFKGPEEYYCTLFHELGHSTGHETRLKRKLANGFGSHAYSAEELVAEFTASYLCGVAGIARTMDNSAAYIAHWSMRLKANPRWLVTAAAQAQRAADYILGKQWTDEAEAKEEHAESAVA